MTTAVATLSASELVLGRYRPLRPLGSGGSGSVWLARDESNGLDVALKIVAREGKAGTRAEREAELLRQDADAYSEKIIVDTRLLWEERQQLIEDIRQLADDVLSTAEDALERVSMPQMLSAVEAGEDGAPTEENGPPTTGEVELDVLPGGADDTDTDDVFDTR